MDKLLEIYIRKNDDKNVCYHIGFLTGVRHALINEHKMELEDLIKAGQIDCLLMGFSPPHCDNQGKDVPAQYIQKYDFCIHIGPQVSDEFIKTLIDAIESGGYLTRLVNSS